MKNTNIELNELEMVNGGNAYSSDLAVWWSASAQNEQLAYSGQLSYNGQLASNYSYSAFGLTDKRLA
ncbi:MAG: hypothetical protein IJM87_06800 [Ruminococcus sp.]|nr:hypothetical protein [Ruminococcus sp.]